MTLVLIAIPLVVCLAFLLRGRYPGERRLRSALARRPRVARERHRTPLLARGFSSCVRGMERGRAPPEPAQ